MVLSTGIGLTNFSGNESITHQSYRRIVRSGEKEAWDDVYFICHVYRSVVSATVPFGQWIKSSFNLLRFFPVRVYSSETIFRKPDRRIYDSVLDRLKEPANRAVMIGDKLREDIKGSARLGITAVLKRGVLTKSRKIPAGVPVVDSIGGLVKLIRQL